MTASGLPILVISEAPPRYWTKRRIQAAQLLGEGVPGREVARRIGRSWTWLSECKRQSYFMARVEETRQAIAAAVMEAGIALKVNRIAGMDDLAKRIWEIIEERGMIERTVTTTESAEIVRERFAREIPAELRALYRAVAEEMGQISEASGVQVNIDNRRQLIYVEGGQQE